jgi:hypothetical protein
VERHAQRNGLDLGDFYVCIGLHQDRRAWGYSYALDSSH